MAIGSSLTGRTDFGCPSKGRGRVKRFPDVNFCGARLSGCDLTSTDFSVLSVTVLNIAANCAACDLTKYSVSSLMV
uniref:pentapeptide repeat-containing protein n=1 Tax=Fulvivirga marina TaxID=2494733 RepID=UPI0037440CFA